MAHLEEIRQNRMENVEIGILLANSCPQIRPIGMERVSLVKNHFLTWDCLQQDKNWSRLELVGKPPDNYP